MRQCGMFSRIPPNVWTKLLLSGIRGPRSLRGEIVGWLQGRGTCCWSERRCGGRSRVAEPVIPMIEPPNQLEPHGALQAQARPVTPVGIPNRVELGPEEQQRRLHPTRRNDDWYWIDDDDPFIVPWGYFEDDDL